jgi:hypothetical protein
METPRQSDLAEAYSKKLNTLMMSLDSVRLHGKERGVKEVIEDCVQPRTRFSGRMDGSSLTGTKDMSSLWTVCGQQFAVTINARHPYVEWQQRVCWWAGGADRVFSVQVRKKVCVQIHVQAGWLKELVPHASIEIDLISIPRPPPPCPPTWEWLGTPASFASLVLVC